MRTLHARAPRRRPALLDADLASIRGGILLVASGAASRVTLSGLRFGERLLPQVVEAAEILGVRVTVDRLGDGPTALVVTARG